MILIQRPTAPAFLIDPESKWQKEIGAAIIHYEQDDAPAFKFENYNDRKLKDELEKVFMKCAYCDSSYGAVYDGDVEHFRPKGKVKEKDPQTPGYYWLANDWENLFLACQHCNQRRRHVLYGEDELETYGKLDQFPLKNETERMNNRTESFNREENSRLLINPCKDDPDVHIAYEENEGVIVPLTEMGKTSVEVYVLQRRRLVQERKKRLIFLFKHMKIAKDLLEEMNSNAIDADVRLKFEEAIDILRYYTNKDQPYAGMCRYFVRRFMEENNLIN